VALAVSGHGFGHAVRCAEVARALLSRGARVVVRSDAPKSLFPPDVEWVPSPGWPLDIGVVQRGGLEMDIDATRQAWREFARALGEHAKTEARLLREARVDLVVGDIPPLAFTARVPSWGLTNFTWDWIYSAWPDFEDIVAVIRQAYAHAEGLFRLPFYGDSGAFAHIEDVPLIARKATRPRRHVRAELEVSDDDTVVLLTFGGFSAKGLDLQRLRDLSEYVFVVTPPMVLEQAPPNVRVLNQSPADYVSLLAACDVVVTKPGYGIVADCLANRVAVLFTDRGPFREYDVLADALTRFGRARYVPREELLHLDLHTHLDELLRCNTPWAELPMNGADCVADRVVAQARI